MRENSVVHSSEAPALEHVVTVCGVGSCPTVYRTDRGTYVIQGYPVDGSKAGIDLPPGELLVEIPADLLAALPRTDLSPTAPGPDLLASAPRPGLLAAAPHGDN